MPCKWRTATHLCLDPRLPWIGCLKDVHYDVQLFTLVSKNCTRPGVPQAKVFILKSLAIDWPEGKISFVKWIKSRMSWNWAWFSSREPQLTIDLFFLVEIHLPPVPSPFVKSPPCVNQCYMILISNLGNFAVWQRNMILRLWVPFYWTILFFWPVKRHSEQMTWLLMSKLKEIKIK